MADMCVAIETVDGCLSTTDSAAGDGSKTSDESTQQLALPTGLDTILAASDFYSPAAARSPRVGSFGRMRGSIVRRSRTRFSLAIQLITAFLTTGVVRRDFQKKEFRPESRPPPGIPSEPRKRLGFPNHKWSFPEASGISIWGCKSPFGSHLGISWKPRKPKQRLQTHTEPLDQLRGIDQEWLDRERLDPKP